MSDQSFEAPQVFDSQLRGMQSPVKLAVLIECVVFPLLRAHPSPVHFDLAVPIDLVTTADPLVVGDLVRSLVRTALVPMAEGGELTVTGYRTAHGIELEIADSVGDLADAGQAVPLAAAALGCRPVWQKCPQGGVAVTITLPTVEAERKVA